MSHVTFFISQLISLNLLRQVFSQWMELYYPPSEQRTQFIAASPFKNRDRLSDKTRHFLLSLPKRMHDNSKRERCCSNVLYSHCNNIRITLSPFRVSLSKASFHSINAVVKVDTVYRTKMFLIRNSPDNLYFESV